MSKGLCFLPISELLAMIRRGEVSPLEVTEEYLERIERLNPEVNAFNKVLKQESLMAAKEAEKAVKERRKLKQLHGIPIALKDVFDMKGLPTTHASKAFLKNIAKHDGTVVEKLREAGAIFLGKLNLQEIAYGPTGEDSCFGPSRNPWNTEYVTGGSSSGSGAAVAASLCAGSLGTDAGGSIRIPASFCGIVGLKPTYGRVSRFGGGVCSWSLDHVGTMTRTVMDTAIMLGVIAGGDPKDPTSAYLPVPSYINGIDKDVKGMRIGILREYFQDADPEVNRCVESAVDELEDLGAKPKDVNIPLAKYARSVALFIMMPEIASFHEPFLSNKPEDYGSFVKARVEVGKLVFATDYIKAQRLRAIYIQEFMGIMKDLDVIVAPTVPIPPPKIGEKEVRIHGKAVNTKIIIPRLTGPFNLIGFPTASIPCGFSPSGLPIGMQISGRPFEEEMVLRVAHAYESSTKWHKMRPPL